MYHGLGKKKRGDTSDRREILQEALNYSFAGLEGQGCTAYTPKNYYSSTDPWVYISGLSLVISICSSVGFWRFCNERELISHSKKVSGCASQCNFS